MATTSVLGHAAAGGKPSSAEAPYTGRNTGCRLVTTDRSSLERNNS
jgi:hypothetical protein